MSEARRNFPSDAKFATHLGIDKAQYSRIKNGDTGQVLSEPKWIHIARKLRVNIGNAPQWVTVQTPVFMFVTAQLEMCQQNGLSTILCDLSDIGKSHAAQHYAQTHKNAVYVDCSQVKSRQKFIRFIAREFGVGHSGKYADVYEDLVFYIKSLENPIIIIDEAGDLDYTAFLELKALWNATEFACGFYMMGADGLEAKMRRSIDCKKVGFAEIFSRFGKRYISVTPRNSEEQNMFLKQTAALIIKANAAPGTDVNKMITQTLGDDGKPSLRRIRKEITKAA